MAHPERWTVALRDVDLVALVVQRRDLFRASAIQHTVAPSRDAPLRRRVVLVRARVVPAREHRVESRRAEAK